MEEDPAVVEDLSHLQSTTMFDIERRPHTGIHHLAAVILEEDNDGEAWEQDTWASLHPNINFGTDARDEVVLQWLGGKPTAPHDDWEPPVGWEWEDGRFIQVSDPVGLFV